jgi:xylulokinase
MDLLLAIDLGSTSIKAVIYDLNGTIISSAASPTIRVNPSTEHPEWAIWDPAQVWDGVCQAIREAGSRVRDLSGLKGIAVTGMGMDGLPVDRDGTPLYPFISWHDPRTMPQAEAWKKRLGELETFSITGFPSWHMMAAMRMLWLAEHHPEIMDKTCKWLFIEDYVNFKLCGTMATDYSMASCSLLFDQRKQAWSDELIRAAGIDRRILPDCLPSGTPLGAVTPAAAAATGLPPRIPVFLGGHDHICCTLPLGGFKDESVVDIIGTWESVLISTPAPVLSPKVLAAQICVQSHVIPNRYVAWGGAVSGESIEWIRNIFRDEKTQKSFEWESVEKALEGAGAKPSGVFYLPHIAGGGCPVGDKLSKGAFVGLTNTTAKANLFRAVFEGLNYQFLDILKAFETSLQVTPKHITVTGGGTRNRFWLQNKADVSGIPISASNLAETTSLGAAILAGIGAGLYRDAEDACNRLDNKTVEAYEPTPALAAYYAEQYGIYKELYPALKAIHHRIGQ